MFNFLGISPAMASTEVFSGFAQQAYQWLPLIFIFVAFYFFLIRPQQKRAQEQRDMLQGLSKGDRILTSGGLIGKFVKVLSDDEVVLEIAKGVEVSVMRSMITQNLSSSSGGKTQSSKSSTSNIKSMADAKKKPPRKPVTTRRKTTKE